jgi:indolepyruvate ferredoxin oxidoreductase, beta subunit
MSTFDTVLAGLGGQGILLASKVLMEQGMQRGVPVRGAETHGMAQRGGSVAAHVRVGPCQSPEVFPRHAHLVLALAFSEGMRALPFLAPGGTLLVNAPDLDDLAPSVQAYIEGMGARVVAVDATRLAQQAGNVRSLNMVMVGAACSLEDSPFDLEGARAAVVALIKPRFQSSSLEALALGAAQL